MKNLYVLLLSFLCSVATAQFTFDKTYHENKDVGYIDYVEHGDIDGDNAADFVMLSRSEKKIYVGLKNGLESPVFETIHEGLLMDYLALQDIDLDGDLDIMATAIFDDLTLLWRNDGNGDFVEDTLFQQEYKSIHFADLTGDGVNEMMLGQNNDLNIYEISTSGITLLKSFSESSSLGAPITIHSLDYNNDGIMDLVVDYSNGFIRIMQQTADLNFTQIEIDTDIYTPKIMSSTDINNDMIPDFLIKNNKETNIFRSIANEEYEKETLPQDFGDYGNTTFADFNQDGIVDILYSNSSFISGRTWIYMSEDDDYTILEIDDEFVQVAGGGFADLDDDGILDAYFFTNDSNDEGLVYFVANKAVDNDNDGYFEDEDCDDNNENVNPGMEEIAYNGLDDDCDELTLDDDLDQDGFVLADDCDDTNPAINPDAEDIPNNGIDEDCDGEDLMTSSTTENNIDFKIYPNPTVQNVQIEISHTDHFTVTLFSTKNQEIFKGVNTNVISLDNVSPGLYYIQIIDTETQNKIVKKVIVQ